MLTNQNIQDSIDVIQKSIENEPSPPQQHHETQQQYEERLRSEQQFRFLAVLGLQLVGNVLQNLNDIAQAANTYSSKP